MTDQLKPCPFCGADYIPLDESPIYGKAFLHPKTEKCVFSDFFVWDYLFELLNTRPIEDALQKRVEELEKEKAELQKSAIVWHRYPDEKPPKAGNYLVCASNNEIDEDLYTDYWWDYNDWAITYWSYLPELPKEEQ